MELAGRQAGQQDAVPTAFSCTSAMQPVMQHPTRLAQACLRASVLAIGLLFGHSANAVGLGALHLKSALSHPLQAQIDLISPIETDLDYRCYQAIVNALDGTQLSKVGITVKSDGSPALILTTTQSIDEPAIALSVSYSCGAATRREYQVLLDFAPTPAVVDTPRSTAAAPASAQPVKQQPDTAPQFTVGTGVANADAPVKKSRHRHNNSEVVPNSAYSPTPPLAGNESTEPRHKTQGAKKFRNVLRLSDDDNVDTSLNDKEGMHLRMSHGLFGSTAAEPEAQSPPASAPPTAPLASAPANTATATGAVPAATAQPSGDQVNQPVAQASNTDLTLQVLQTKIRLLEAQTEELRKLNAIQQGKLDAAQKVKSDKNQLLSLYFLLFLSFIAIVWLVWRMRQIEADITDSHWHHIVPDAPEATEQEEAKSEPAAQPRTALDDDDDSFLDEPPRKPSKPDAGNVKPIKPLPIPKLVTPVGTEDVPVQADVEMTAAPAEARPKSDNNEMEYKPGSTTRAALPDAEEILDEIQQAEFWMEMHQPDRAIEILESNWGGERPSSPLPWLYLLDLYKQVGDRDRYEDLTARFEHIFNGRVERWDENKDDLPVQRSIEDFPAVLKKIIELWPTPDIVPYMENLLVDDRDGRRQGFELSVYRDILFLTNIAYEVQDDGGESRAANTAPEWSLLN